MQGFAFAEDLLDIDRQVPARRQAVDPAPQLATVAPWVGEAVDVVDAQNRRPGPSATSWKIFAWVASNTAGRSTRRPPSSLISKKRRQLMSSAAVRQLARR